MTEFDRRHMQSPKRPIFPALDAVRFLTAVIVMIYHLFFWKNGDVPDASQTTDLFWRFGWVGVEIFFTLSGLVIALSAQKSTPIKFLIDRTVRLAPTIWICATTTLVGTLALAPSLNVGRLLNDYLWTVILRPVGGHIDIVYWTLTVEISFYALICFLLFRSNFRTLVRVLIAVGLVSTAYDSILALAPYIHAYIPRLTDAIAASSKFHLARLLLLRHGCFFALGVLIWSLKEDSRPKYCLLLIAIFFLGGTLEVWYSAQRQILDLSAHGLSSSQQLSVAQPVIAWLIGISLIFLSRLLRAEKMHTGFNLVSSLRYLGLLTFPIYLLHNNFGMLIEDKITQFGVDETAAGFAAMLIVICASSLVVSLLEPRLSRVLKANLQKAAARWNRGATEFG